MSTEIEPRPRPDQRLIRSRAAIIVLLSGTSLALGLWLGLYALFLAVPVLVSAIRYRCALGRHRAAPALCALPAVVHGVGMLVVFLLVPAVQHVRDAANRLSST
jgi:hypothetical protein